MLLICVSTMQLYGSSFQVPTQYDIEAIAKRVADWQIDNFTYSTTNRHDYGISSWGHAVWYQGLFQWAKISDEGNSYFDWFYNYIGPNSDWKLNGIYPYHADEFCVGQFFTMMYEKFDDLNMLENTLERVDNVLSADLNPSMAYTNKQRWTWCDALFMAPPLYAQLSAITNDNKYLEYMHTEFTKTYGHLYDTSENLFFRDDSYFNKTETNGKKVFWGRGNGWALAGTANIIKNLAENSIYREYYIGVFRELALSLIALQDEDGAWHASLLDPESYPAPETSATALITYGLAYGLNNELLSYEEAYEPVLKAWNKLNEAVLENGKLGWVQPIGQDPKTVTKDMTAPFGVGAFLMTAAEMYLLVDKETSAFSTILEEDFSNPNTQIKVFSLDGKIVLSEKMDIRTMAAWLDNLQIPPGIYLIQYTLHNQFVVYKYKKQ